MRAADALIESLEREVADLRRELARASEALRAAQEEVAARGRAFEGLEENEHSWEAAEEQVRALRSELVALRKQSADEQLRLRNEHMAAITALQEELEEQRNAGTPAAKSEGKINALREEFRKERAALEASHRSEVEELKRSAAHWEEKLRDGYRELEEHHKVEIEKLRREHAEEIGKLIKEHRTQIEALHIETEGKIDPEQTTRDELEREQEEDRRAERQHPITELQALSSAAASRKLELQKELKSAIEGRQAEADELGFELERASAVVEERRKNDLQEIKRHAEVRERELERTQAQRLAEEKEAAERRIASLKAQSQADIISLKEQHAGELAKVRQDLEDRLATEEERHRSQIATLEEQLAGVRMRQQSETRLYGERLKELELQRTADKKAAEERLERLLAEAEEEKSRLMYRIAELEVDLEESGAVETELREALEENETREETWQQEEEQSKQTLEDLEEQLKEADTARLLAEERAADLEVYLREAEEENQRRSEELQKALEDIRKFSEPEQRLRAGISLFNASEHTRTVASISKSFGLPKIHIGSDSNPDSPSKPVITFVWEAIAWRRYVSDPTEGVEEPRVYLIGTGDDPSEIPDCQPNARMDAQGHLILGVQAF